MLRLFLLFGDVMRRCVSYVTGCCSSVMTTVTRRQHKTARRSWQRSSCWRPSRSSFYHTPSTSSSRSTRTCPTKACRPPRRSCSSSTWRCCRTLRWSVTRSSTASVCADVRPPVTRSSPEASTLTPPARRPSFGVQLLPRRQWQDSPNFTFFCRPAQTVLHHGRVHSHLPLSLYHW